MLPSGHVLVAGGYTGTNGNYTYLSSTELYSPAESACYLLTKMASPAHAGDVIANPASNCENGTQYLAGTVVQLSAAPRAGFVFANWDGGATGTSDSVAIAMDGHKSVIAYYAPAHPVQFYLNAGYQTGYCSADSEGGDNLATRCAGYDRSVSSLLLQAGWSIRLFEAPDQAGRSRCLMGSDNSLADNSFEDGTALNDAMSSYALFHQAVCPALPGSFNKSSPVDGATTDQAANLTLSWGSSLGASAYEYCYDTTDDGTCSGTWTSTGNTTSVVLSGLGASTTYYWQVRARNDGGTLGADNGSWRNFTNIAHSQVVLPPQLVSPLDGSSNSNDYDLTFEWSPRLR